MKEDIVYSGVIEVRGVRDLRIEPTTDYEKIKERMRVKLSHYVKHHVLCVPKILTFENGKLVNTQRIDYDIVLKI